MGIYLEHLQRCVIRPSLEPLGLYSGPAEQLLLGTLAVESDLGYFLQQTNGPALGIYQIEPATHQDIWDNYLAYKNTLAAQIGAMLPVSPDVTIEQLLITDLRYATIIARLVYYRQNEPLPNINDYPAQAAYWKKYYNTEQGKGSVEQYERALVAHGIC